MSSLEEIDKLFKKAQETIWGGDPEYVRSVLWPEIRNAIETTPDLSILNRMKLRQLIVERLDEQSNLLIPEENPHVVSVDELLKREYRPPIWHAW